MAGSLSSEQIAHYRAQGYAVVPRLLEERELERYRVRARQIALGDYPPEARSRVVRDVSYVKGRRPLPDDPELAMWKLLNPDRFDPLMAECLRLPRVLDAVESLLGPDLLAFLLMFIYKPPGVPESIHPFHQDAVFFPFGPHADVVGVWIAADPVNEKNGGLCVVPGSHRGGVSGHETLPGVNFGAFAAEGAEADEELRARSVAFELPPGDGVLFHSRLLHRTGGNQTPHHRRVITLHVASARCTPNAGTTAGEYGFASVRGRTHPGCLQPVASPSLAMRPRGAA